MSQIKPPCGKFFPHGEFGIAAFPFGDSCKLLWRSSAIGVGGVSVSRIRDFDVLQCDILYAEVGGAGDNGRGGVARLVFHGSFIAVTCIGLVERHFGIEIFENDIAQRSCVRRIAVARGETQEERVAGVDAAKAVDNNGGCPY